MARRGYAAFSISYRLTGRLNLSEAVIHASEDYRAAIRFLRSKEKEWRLDTERIVASGYSAGAKTAIHIG